MSEKKMMLGNAAIARGVWEAGCKVSSAYPGTPSTEISEELVKYPGVYAEWAPNEKVAAEVAIGASISGVRSFCTMKMVGLNVAADPLYSFSYIGCNGGMVAVVADDPGLYSSQNEQDTRMVCRAAAIPCMEPADSQEAKDYIKYAYEISEKFDTPVIVRTTTRLAHSQCEVELCDREEIEDKPYERNIQKNVMMPGMAKKRHLVVEQRMKDLAEYANNAPFNTVEMGDMTLNGKKIGFITEGIAYQYVKEVCPNASILKLGMCHPLPKKLIEDFASKVDELYIFEELEPVVEEQVRSWGIPCIGKERFTIQGEYSANMIREKVLGLRSSVPDALTALLIMCSTSSRSTRRAISAATRWARWHRSPLSTPQYAWDQASPHCTAWRKPRGTTILRTGWRSSETPLSCIRVSTPSSTCSTTSPTERSSFSITAPRV